MPDFTAAGSPPADAASFVVTLVMAALLGAALGVIRPVRGGIVPRSAHVIQAQILLAIVGAIIIVVVAESLARAFAIVGAAGLVRYRARIGDPKDAGVMLVALAVGLTVGTGLITFAAIACVFVIAVLWLFESLEPPARSRMELKIATTDAEKLRTEVEHALDHRGVGYHLLAASPKELRYEVTVPFKTKIDKLTKTIRKLDEGHHAVVDWDVNNGKNLHR